MLVFFLATGLSRILSKLTPPEPPASTPKPSRHALCIRWTLCATRHDGGGLSGAAPDDVRLHRLHRHTQLPRRAHVRRVQDVAAASLKYGHSTSDFTVYTLHTLAGTTESSGARLMAQYAILRVLYTVSVLGK